MNEISSDPRWSSPVVLKGRHGDPQKRVDAVVAKLLAPCPQPRVLEAGCGSASRVALPVGRYLVGVDIEQRQLDKNTLLDEKHLGDLQSFSLSGPAFDLVICWDVVEHLPDPVKALERMSAALTPGGGLLLAFPNLWSLKGLITKFTPYIVHEWFYRYVIGDRRARNEWDQFPTTLRLSIAPPAMRRWAAQNGLEVVYDEVYEGPVQSGLRRDRGYMNLGFGALSVISRMFTLGSIDLGLSDCIMLFRKPTN